MKDKMDLENIGIRCIGDEQSPYRYDVPYCGEIDLGYAIDIDIVYTMIYDQGERDGMEVGRLMGSGLGPTVKDLVIRYNEWLVSFNPIDGVCYSSEQLYDMFIKDVMNSKEQ